MIRTFSNSFKVSFAENANTFIHFLKRVPLIGKKIPDTLYKETNVKVALGIIGKIIGLLIGFFKKAFYLGVMILLPSYLMTKDIDKSMTNFLHIFFFLSLVLGSLIRTIILDSTNKKAFNMINLMRCDAREFYIGEIIYSNIEKFIHFIVPMIIIGLIIGLSPYKAFVLMIEFTFLRFIGEWFNVIVYRKTQIVIVTNNYIMSIASLLGIACAYGLPIVGKTINFQKVLFNNVTIISILFLGSMAFLYLWKFKGYTLISKKILTKDKLNDIEAIKTDLKFADVKIDEKKMNKEDLKRGLFENKQGYEYLNALFFKRHRRIMIAPVRIRVFMILAAFIIISGIMLFFPEHRESLLGVIKKSGPVMVFIMYTMSTGERICKAMFYNCDISLLRYGYYRQGKVILSNFTSRLKRTVILNIIPAFALCLAMTGIIAISGYASELITLIPLFLSILCLACFFAIHHLFLYYVIQPYTKELTVKSPLFKIVNSIIYIISYICLQVKTSSLYFTLGVMIVTIIYMLVALALTYKLAPKTFRLK